MRGLDTCYRPWSFDRAQKEARKAQDKICLLHCLLFCPQFEDQSFQVLRMSFDEPQRALGLPFSFYRPLDAIWGFSWSKKRLKYKRKLIFSSDRSGANMDASTRFQGCQIDQDFAYVQRTINLQKFSPLTKLWSRSCATFLNASKTFRPVALKFRKKFSPVSVLIVSTSLTFLFSEPHEANLWSIF